MKPQQIAYLAGYGFRTLVLKQRKPIIAGIPLTDVCNLHRQRRVAFTILGADTGRSVQGSGIARIAHTGAGTADDVEDIRQKSLRRPYPLNSIRLYVRFASLAAASIALAGLLRLIV